MITKTIIMKVGGGIMEIPRYKSVATAVPKDTPVEAPPKRPKQLWPACEARAKRSA